MNLERKATRLSSILFSRREAYIILIAALSKQQPSKLLEVANKIVSKSFF